MVKKNVSKMFLSSVKLLFLASVLLIPFQIYAWTISIKRPVPCLTDIDLLKDVAGPGIITIMDANLSDPRWECHFQWWNNYCFPTGVTPKTTAVKPIWRDYYNNSNYSSSTFVKILNGPYDYWYKASHDWVWWGAGDGPGNNRSAIVPNPLDRQWPCPVWFHVPSAWEWWLLVRYWRDTYATDVVIDWDSGLYFLKDAGARARFMSYFNLSFAGDRFFSNAALHWQWSLGYYWSSSPTSPLSNHARRLRLSSVGVYATDSYYRARALSVRCFKN